MAVYKVPQDVEADDKLIGPFSFRQFIYLIIVSLAIMGSWGLGQLFVPLAIIPFPVIVFFGALALPLRKDQPMEIFMAALVSFYLKPHKRLWDPDGIDSLIEITVPKVVEVQLTKDLSQNEAQRRLSYLADIVDSRGWAVRGVGVQAPNSAVSSDVYFEAQQTQDVLDNDNTTAQNFKFKLDQSDTNHHKEIINMMNHNPAPITKPLTPPSTPAPTPSLTYSPYPNNIQQSVVQPLSEADQIEKQPTEEVLSNTSENMVSADIINLANNNDLTIETIAREANRVREKQDEVFIPLR
ncbi:MAG: hypothetical protein PWQ10_438 [Patescibacteria group bacterium]|nr:hypothetical protein [Patescibacteria group bacterium]